MRIKSLLSILCVLGFMTAPVLAGTGRARLDFTVKKGELKLGQSNNKKFHFSHPGWVKDEAKRKKTVTSNLPVSDEKWTKVTIELTPTEDGPMTIALRGQWEKKMRNWAYFDDITAEGAEIKNPGFEKTGGWVFPKGQQVLDESLAHSGKGAVLVWHDKAAYQTVRVKAGQPVKITAWIKFCKQEPKDPSQ